MLDLLTQDWMTPVFAFAVSAIGAFLGLSFASRAHRVRGISRWQWLAMASVALGGMAVWSMHSIAMMGFSPPGVAVRYDPLLTLASGLLATAAMAAALTVSLLRRTTVGLLAAGVIAGGGVAGMYYTGMASMNVHGSIHHDPLYVILACAIALVAATAALWSASRLRGHLAIMGASAAMAVALTGMHYTGMAGVRIEPPRFVRFGAPDGSTAADLALPLIVGLFVFLLICSLFLLLGVEEERPSYGARPAVHSAPPGATAARDTAPPGYFPRHANAAPPAAGGSDDVWTRRR
ncbi:MULTISPECIES: MHYT domain-containing protein [unclassified Nocardiopsis]|uniref:MHYT domain-containing protein n=1 Tax=unclassified Nocardiopsis TaxID=2649073 RepID=UPI0013579AAC|nr:MULTISPECIES: MHYT domain-containing protein [unclassified Nocardiopsis]